MRKVYLLFVFILFTALNLKAQTYTITTMAGDFLLGGYSGDGGPATSALLNRPASVALDASGNVYIADESNSRIRKINASTGIIITIAGNGKEGHSGDGGRADSAELFWPSGVAVDASGNVYISDTYNNRIRKVSAGTGIITTIAGNGAQGYSGDGGRADSAALNYPGGVAVDDSGNVYIADFYNNRIRKVNIGTGYISTIAGNGTGGYSGDSIRADSAELNFPTGVAVDASRNVYIADQHNNRVRMVSFRTGIITSIAGNGIQGFSGDGGSADSAELNYPSGVAVDDSGNVYIADYSNSRIRRVNVSKGYITSIAGTDITGYSGDGGIATSERLSIPFGVAVDDSGNVYIADLGNNLVRKLTPTSSVAAVTNAQNTALGVTVYPNPTTDNLTISSPSSGFEIAIYDALGSKVATVSAAGNQYNLPTSSFKKGMYMVVVTLGDNNFTSKVVIE